VKVKQCDWVFFCCAVGMYYNQ